MKSTLAQKLLAFQAEVGTVTKDAVNPFFSSQYFDINKLLEVVKPTLSKHGIVCIQPLTNTVIGDTIKPMLTTVLINAEDANDKMSSAVPLPDVPDPQKFGGAITYFRRYALVSVLGLQAEDDDGNALVKKPGSKASAKPAKGSIF